MAIFRRQPERIRGIAGTLEKKPVLLFDAVEEPGPGIARVLAEAGAHLFLVAVDKIGLELQIAGLRNSPGEVVALTADDHSEEDMRQIVQRVKEPLEAAIINPAPSQTGHPVPDHASFLARLIADGMRDRGSSGSLVLITGIPRRGEWSSRVAYLEAEMERLAVTYASNAIRINAVAPGHVAVNRRGHSTSSGVAPLGHQSVHPIEVGKAVWFLINDDLSSGITGTSLKTDRGGSLLLPDW
jgi:NAD(P)-dependent dehydrogenase (short-subunit alcohol dehydrogenase family)